MFSFKNNNSKVYALLFGLTLTLIVPMLYIESVTNYIILTMCLFKSKFLFFFFHSSSLNQLSCANNLPSFFLDFITYFCVVCSIKYIYIENLNIQYIVLNSLRFLLIFLYTSKNITILLANIIWQFEFFH